MATRTAATAAVAGGGLLLAATAASAATGAGAAPSVGFSTMPVSYNCPMTDFGANMAPLNLAATISAPAQATAGTTITVKLVTNSMTVPSATAANLPAITNFALNGNAAFTGAFQGNANLSGGTALTAAAGALTQIPSVTVTATVTPSGTGQTLLAAPTTVTIQLTGASQMAPITCNLASPASMPLNLLAAGATGTGTGTTGGATGAQLFTCTITTAGGSANTMNMAMNLGFSGLNAMGNTGRVWMTGAFGSQMANATPTSTNASLGLSGMSTGSVPLSASTAGGKLTLAGKWMPMHTGMTKLTAPHRFQMQMRQQATTVVVVCTATTQTTASTMVNVSASGMSSAAAQGVAAGEGTGVAAGAPNTGGGGSLHSASDTGLMAGGGAALLAGIGIVLYAMRRRSRATSI